MVKKIKKKKACIKIVKGVKINNRITATHQEKKKALWLLSNIIEKKIK